MTKKAFNPCTEEIAALEAFAAWLPEVGDRVRVVSLGRAGTVVATFFQGGGRGTHVRVDGREASWVSVDDLVPLHPTPL